jgi:hypothetical protein
VTNEGRESVITTWGSRSCEHYHASVLNQGTTGNVTMDFFLYANIMVRMEGNDGVSTFSMLLTGTNIPVIVNG